MKTHAAIAQAPNGPLPDGPQDARAALKVIH